MCFDGFGKNNNKKIREIMKQIHAILQLIRWVYLQSFGEFPALNLKAVLIRVSILSTKIPSKVSNMEIMILKCSKTFPNPNIVQSNFPTKQVDSKSVPVEDLWCTLYSDSQRNKKTKNKDSYFKIDIY